MLPLENTPPPPAYIVGIGGSAGALDAYKDFLDFLPSKTGMAFVFVTHILPDAISQMAEILSRHTKMPVLLASTALRVRTNHVYVSPPNSDVIIEGNTFKIIHPRTKGNVIVDYLLTSLAEARGPRAIAVIASGYDGDGTEGCRQIKAKGGTTFAQDKSAAVNGMPLSAQAAGCIDFVLPMKEIAKALARISRASPS